MFDTSFHEDMHRELERLMKTQWFASHNHQSIDELIGSGTRNKKPDDTSSRPKSPTAVRRPSTSIGVRTGTFTIAEEPTGNGNHAVDSSAKDADPIVINEETIRRRRLSMEQKQQHAIADPLAHHLSAEIRNSLAYKDLIRLRARQLDSPLIKAFRPQTAPPGVCPRRLLAVKPIPAQCGAIMINAKSKRSVMAKFSAAVQEEEMWRLTAKNARLADGKDINDMQPECHSMRLQRPHTAHPSSASTESTVCKPTIASSLRVEGVLAKKRRKVFATITHANNASLHTRMKLDYSDLEQSLVVTPFKAEYVAEWGECTQHTVNMAYFPFNDSPTMGELCLEACSPMVNAAIQTVPRIMVPEPSMRERRLSIAVVGTARRSSEGAANFIQSAKLTNTQLRDAWQRYERQVMAAKEERDPVDLIDKFQLRLNSFRW